MSELLDGTILATRLKALPGWSGGSDGITRTAQLPSFQAALDAVARIGAVAEEMDHHPDIDIRWRTVRFACVTHSAGGVTERDLDLAARIDELLRSVPPAAD